MRENKIYAELNQDVWKIYDMENNLIESFRTKLIADERIIELNKFGEDYKLIRDNTIRDELRKRFEKSVNTKSHRQGNKTILKTPFNPKSFLADLKRMIKRK